MDRKIVISIPVIEEKEIPLASRGSIVACSASAKNIDEAIVIEIAQGTAVKMRYRGCLLYTSDAADE